VNPLRKLAGQTAIYGLSSIVGRLLNYLLVPLHTRVFMPEAYGVVTEMYSYVAFLMIVLTYGFETAFFRFASNQEDRPNVYATSLISLFFSSLAFFLLCWIFSQPLANQIRYPNHAEYIVWFALILATDAITSIPIARLRLENRPIKFAVFKLVNIGINIFINVFFLILCPWILKNGSTTSIEILDFIYNPEIGIGYVFIANLVASLATFFMLMPDMWKMSWKFDSALWKRMMRYGLPLLIGGLAGITNEMFSRVSMKYQLPESIAMHELGVFGACYKVAILMTIFIQTFRFAAEPFFFSQAREKHAKRLYAQVMHWFVIACSIIYLGVLLFMNLVKYFIGEAYYEGLSVVPILLMANLFLGIFFNLSIWFKLNDRTFIGAWLAIFGSVMTLLLNFLWVPHYGYVGASWATFIVYFLMMVVSYFLGQRFFPVQYDLRKVIGYPLFAALLVFSYSHFLPMEGMFSHVLKGLVLFLFIGLVWLFEVRKKSVFSPETNSKIAENEDQNH
jgi:O-antigen/teichoic acid export membrane protein